MGRNPVSLLIVSFSDKTVVAFAISASIRSLVGSCMFCSSSWYSGICHSILWYLQYLLYAMHRFLLYPSFVFRLAMSALTASGWFRLVCLLRKLRAFLVNLIVYSLLLSFFIWIKTFKIGVGFGKMGVVCWL